MRAALACVALSVWASSAAAQVSFVRNDVADTRVAAALERLIGDDVRLVDGGVRASERGARVSIDRARAELTVVVPSRPEGLTRVLDARLLADSPYAVAVAAAELLDLLRVAPRPERIEATTTRVLSPVRERDRDEVEPPEEVEAPAEAARPPAPAAVASVRDSIPSRRTPARVQPESNDELPAPDYAIGVDLDVQAPLRSAVSFVRPALYAELAWQRPGAGMFWLLGARASAPFGRDLQPPAADAQRGMLIRAVAMDAAFQAGAGYSFGRLAVSTHLAAGVSYLRVDAFGAGQRALGHDTQISPLLAAGAGARFSLALGLALAVRGETQWAGPGAHYSIAGDRVLSVGALRLGLVAGILWESALGAAGS